MRLLNIVDDGAKRMASSSTTDIIPSDKSGRNPYAMSESYMSFVFICELAMFERSVSGDEGNCGEYIYGCCAMAGMTTRVMRKKYPVAASATITISFRLFLVSKNNGIRTNTRDIALLSLSERKSSAVIYVHSRAFFVSVRRKYIQSTKNTAAVGSGCQSVTSGFSVPAKIKYAAATTHESI